MAIKTVFDHKNGTPISSGTFIKAKNKWLFLILVSIEEGKEKRSAFAIVDYFLQNHSQDKRVLDFFGSDIKSIADSIKVLEPKEMRIIIIKKIHFHLFLS